jgi:hypothetical protein
MNLAGSYSAHDLMVMRHGGQAAREYVLPVLPPVDMERVLRPLNPGMPPCWHINLPDPNTLRLVALPITGRDEVDGEDDILLMDEGKAQQRAAESQTPTAPEVSLSQPAPGIMAPPMLKPAAPAGATQPVGQRFDPLYPFLLFLALGIGTIFLETDPAVRYTLLWGVLILLGIFFSLLNVNPVGPAVTSSSLIWGFSIGLVFSLPLLILVSSGLSEMAAVLYPGANAALMFQSLAFVGPLGETLFFRGALQDRRGIFASVAGAGITSLLFYWPSAAHSPAYLVAVTIFSTVLAGIYSFMRTRYGLSAAYASQVTANLMLLFIPGLLA